MTWNINLSPPTVIAATPMREPFELLKNTLWQGCPPLIQPFHYICGTDFCLKQKSLLISCEPQDCIHIDPLQLTSMDSLITTTQRLHRQDAKSLRMRNQQKDTLGNSTANMTTLWDHTCIITDVRSYTSWPRQASA
jgi:hypothetical protein